MYYVINSKCNCGKSYHPSFNFVGSNAEYCGECKLDGMVNVKSKPCKCENTPYPSFNYQGLSPEYCSLCKLDGMIDVSNRKCVCGKSQPRFNFKGGKPIYCAQCKSDNMINMVDKKCCCGNNRAYYNYKGKSAEYCVDCKLEEMINVIIKKCKGNYCIETTANPKYKGYCKQCYQLTFPTDSLTFQMKSKTKEIAVRDFINSKFDGFSHDQPLWTGNCECTHRRRIDHRKLIGNTLLCIETDENQHKSYNNKDEEIRYDDLFMIHGGKFIFIRFNPDKYLLNGKSKNPYLFIRLTVLEEEIKKQINRIENVENKELLEIIKLFYDGFDCKNIENNTKLENTFVERK